MSRRRRRQQRAAAVAPRLECEESLLVPDPGDRFSAAGPIPVVPAPLLPAGVLPLLVPMWEQER